jgi:DNA-binding NarL/FixJ family response regulator
LWCRTILSLVSGSPDERSAVLVDKHPPRLDTLERVLTGTGIRVVARHASAQAALECLPLFSPDLLVTGLEMGDGDVDGLELVRRARAALPGLKTIVLSMHADDAHINAAFGAGADAYVLKTAHPEDLSLAVRQAFEHSVYLAYGRPAPVPANAPGLTRREIEILQLVAEGHSNAGVAKMLWVTEQTVKFHLSNIYRKLGVANRTEASRWAQLQGLLNQPLLAA